MTNQKDSNIYNLAASEDISSKEIEYLMSLKDDSVFDVLLWNKNITLPPIHLKKILNHLKYEAKLKTVLLEGLILYPHLPPQFIPVIFNLVSPRVLEKDEYLLQTLIIHHHLPPKIINTILNFDLSPYTPMLLLEYQPLTSHQIYKIFFSVPDNKYSSDPDMLRLLFSLQRPSQVYKKLYTSTLLAHGDRENDFLIHILKSNRLSLKDKINLYKIEQYFSPKSKRIDILKTKINQDPLVQQLYKLNAIDFAALTNSDKTQLIIRLYKKYQVLQNKQIKEGQTLNAAGTAL